MLENCFCLEGKKSDEFFTQIAEVDKATSVRIVTGPEITLCTPASELDSGVDFGTLFDDTLRFVRRNVYDKVSVASLKPVAFVEENPDVACVIEDAVNCREPLISVDGITLFARARIIQELASFVKLKGTALTKENALRDRYINYLVNQAKQSFTLVLREEQNVQKVQSVRSGKYKPVEQMLLRELFEAIVATDNFTTVTTRFWHIDHDISYIDYEFPELMEEMRKLYSLPEGMNLIPGMRLSTGSTGYNTMSFTMTWRHPDREPMKISTLSKKHTASFDKNEFISSVTDSLWKNYCKLPEALVERLTEDVLDGTENATDAKDILDCVMRNAFSKLQVAKIFMQSEESIPKRVGADYRTQIINLVIDDIYEEGKAITGYDIAMSLMTVTERLKGLPDSYKEPLADRLGEAAYVSYLPPKAAKLSL